MGSKGYTLEQMISNIDGKIESLKKLKKALKYQHRLIENATVCEVKFQNLLDRLGVNYINQFIIIQIIV